MSKKDHQDAKKDASVRIRLTEAQRKKLEMAAEKAGLDLSSWLRFVGLREADGASAG